MIRLDVKTVLSAFLVAISIGMSSPAASGAREARKYADYLIQAQEAAKVGNHQKSAESYEKAFRLIDQLGYSPEETEDEKVATLTWLAESYDKQGRYDDALRAYQQAVAIVDRLHYPPKKPATFALSGLAKHQHRLGRYEDALRTYERLLPLERKLFGPSADGSVAAMHDMAVIQIALGHPRDAEGLLREAIDILEAKPGDKPLLVTLMNTLGTLYFQTDRETLGRQLHQRALEIQAGTSQGGAGFREVRPDESIGKGKYRVTEDEQERKNSIVDDSIRKRAEAARRQSGPDEVALALSSVADFAMQTGRDSESERLYREILAIQESYHGRSHPRVAQTLCSLGILYIESGRHNEAERHLKQAESIFESELGGNNQQLVQALLPLSNLYMRQGKFREAIAVTRRAMRIIWDSYATDPSDVQNIDKPGWNDIGLRRGVRIFAAYHYLRLLDQARTTSETFSGTATEESFEAQQIITTGITSAALSQMAARFASGTDELASLIKRYQDLIQQKRTLDKALITSIGAEDDSRARRKGDLARVKEELESLNRTLNQTFPEYSELTNPQPLELAQAQRLLTSQEALVSYVLGSNQSWLWVVRRDKSAFIRIDVGRKEIADQVQHLRRYLDPENYRKIFPVNVAHDLYKTILGPAQPYLAGVTHVMIVPHDALQSLPFSVLVTDAPAGEITGFKDYPDVSWLAKKYAITTLPSISSLRALRRFAKAAPAPQPFTGFGNPLLEGDPADNRGISVAKLFSRGSIANADEVRRLPSLPDTEKELKTLADAFHAPSSQVFVREAATESRVKRQDLSKYRVIAFSTHGLVAGDIKGLAEPALVFTPPHKGSEQDDGLLTASEVAKLKLNADWVILSACNTAGPDGTPGAEGLSGLGKAFIYAGSRALLVSHWPVVSDAAVLLITRMVDESAAGAGRAEALRRSMLALMQGKNNPAYAHPMAWAPFVVVGEGAR